MPTIKELNTTLRLLQEQLDALNTESKTINNKIKKKKDEITDVTAKIVNANLKITVSEHAVLRYLERVNNVNIEEIKEKILTPQIKQQIQSLGSGVYPVNGTFKIRVKNNVIVTIVNHDNNCQ